MSLQDDDFRSLFRLILPRFFHLTRIGSYLLRIVRKLHHSMVKSLILLNINKLIMFTIYFTRDRILKLDWAFLRYLSALRQTDLKNISTQFLELHGSSSKERKSYVKLAGFCHGSATSSSRIII